MFNPFKKKDESERAKNAIENEANQGTVEMADDAIVSKMDLEVAEELKPNKKKKNQKS